MCAILSRRRRWIMKTFCALLAISGVCGSAFAQSTLNMSEDLVRLGIASTNMVPNQPNLDAGPLFFQAVLYAQNHKIGAVIADPGSYYFLSLQSPQVHLAWDSLSNLTIDLHESDLYFTHPLVSGLLVTNSKNVVLENFTADYNPLPFTQVRVVSVNPAQQTIQFAVDGNWQNPSALNAVFPTIPNEYGVGVEVHMFRNGRPIPGVTRMYATNPLGTSQFTAIPDPGPTAGTVLSQIRPGDIAFLGMRAFSIPVSTLFCTGCTFRNIAVYSCTGQGFEAAFSQSSVFERIYSIPRPGTDRLAGNYAAILLTGMGPNNQVRLNRIIRSMDDGMEYDSLFFGQVTSQTNPRTFVLGETATSLVSVGVTAPNGSTVSFQSLSDGSIVASAVVVSQTAPTGQPSQMTVTVDRDLPASVVSTQMFGPDVSQRAGNSVVERNALEEETDCCRGFLFAGTVNGVFHGNYIRRSAMAAVHVDNTPQLLSLGVPPSENLSLTNNVTDGANWIRTAYPVYQLGSIVVDTIRAGNVLTASPNQNISLTGNFTADSGDDAVWFSNVSGGTVSGNYFLNPNINPAVESAEATYGPVHQPLVEEALQNVTTGNNTIDQTSGRMWITDGQFRELAAYAPGSTVRLNAYEIGTLSSSSVTLTDADGNVTTTAVQASTAHSIDVEIPASAALGGAYLTFAAGGLKYFGTLFIDSQDNVPALNGCTYELSPASSTTGANANSVAILVVTQSGCSYGVSVNDSFVSSSATATGTAVVSVGFAANSGAARSATVEIAGQTSTLTQAAADAARPVIQAIVDPWNYASGLAPGEWVTIGGTELATGPPRIWNLSGTQKLPPSLGEVNVTFNGIPAALLYVSSTQINALVPAMAVPGPVQVVVQSNGVSSNPFTITATAIQPAIYALPAADGATFFVTAALAGTATLIGNSAVDPRVVRAAQPGDVLDLYMLGLGTTTDSSKFLTDQIFAGAYPVNASVTATVGGESSPVLFSGLTSPGLYLVRVVIPQDLSQGVKSIQVSAGSRSTAPSLKLLVGPPP
jgi:uncharacterized protein (TIGR03437 family)